MNPQYLTASQNQVLYILRSDESFWYLECLYCTELILDQNFS